MTRNAFWGLCIGICMASTQSVAQKIENTNIQTDNQKNYTPSHINEITNGESLYTVRSDTSLHNIRTIQANSNPEVLDKLTAELKPAIVRFTTSVIGASSVIPLSFILTMKSGKTGIGPYCTEK